MFSPSFDDFSFSKNIKISSLNRNKRVEAQFLMLGVGTREKPLKNMPPDVARNLLDDFEGDNPDHRQYNQDFHS